MSKRGNPIIAKEELVRRLPRHFVTRNDVFIYIIMKWLLYVTFFLFSLGQIGRISFFGQQINAYAYEIGLLIILFTIFLKYKLEPVKQGIRRLRIPFIFITYLSFSFLVSTFFYSLHENVTAGLYLARMWSYFLFFVYLIYYLEKHTQDLVHFTRGIWMTIGITIISSVLQYFLYPDLANLFYAGWDGHLYRIFGFFFEPAIAAAVYGIFLLILLTKDLKVKFPWLQYLLIGIFGLFIFLTYSRGAFLALAVTLGIFLFSQKKALYLFVIGAVFIVGILLLPKKFGEGVNLMRVSTIQSRFIDYQEGFKIWQKNPVLGIGYNHIRFEKKGGNRVNEFENYSHAGASFHSSFLMILVTGGIIGLILYIWNLHFIATHGNGMKYLILYLAIFSLTDNALLHPFIAFLVFSFLAHAVIRPSDT